MAYYLIGYPLGYSCSPTIHKLFNREIDYSQKKLNEEEFVEFIKSKEFDGLNITIPYKEKILPYLDVIEETSLEIGAINTVVNKDGVLYGYNTDILGVELSFKKNHVKLENKVVMILGSGGTYKTISHLLNQKHLKKLYQVSRTPKEGFITYQEAVNKEDVEILINTTPVGTFPNVNQSPIDISNFKKLECIFDMIYNPNFTSLLLQGKRRGIKVINGLQTLVYQAGFAQELFFDHKIDYRKYNGVYRHMQKENQSFTLVGLPGSGKTTLGKLLARRMKYTYLDTDQEIERREGMSVQEIFEKKGEAYFRKKEQELIEEIYLEKKLVISTGGGMIENERIMNLLSFNSKIIYLNRMMSDNLFNGVRPLLKSPSDYYALKSR